MSAILDNLNFEQREGGDATWAISASSPGRARQESGAVPPLCVPVNEIGIMTSNIPLRHVQKQIANEMKKRIGCLPATANRLYKHLPGFWCPYSGGHKRRAVSQDFSCSTTRI
jgi:hypothetical protein